MKYQHKDSKMFYAAYELNVIPGHYLIYNIYRGTKDIISELELKDYFIKVDSTSFTGGKFPIPIALQRKCDCGGDKSEGLHAQWCKTQENL